MALGWNGDDNNTTSISLKLVAVTWPVEKTRENEPKLVVKAKNESTGYYELTNDKHSQVEWRVVSIRTSHNGKTGRDEVRWFVACLQDGDERYYIDATMTNASKDLANHLLANIWKDVKISLYLNQDKREWKQWDYYPSASVKTPNGEHTPTHLDYKNLDKIKLWDEIKAQEEVTNPVESPDRDTAWDIDIEDVPF